MSRASLQLIVAAAVAVSTAVFARADEAPGRQAAPVTESGPEVYYLQDDAGRLVPVPGFRYRDFLELFRLREGLPAALEPPAAVLESLVVRADLAATAAAGTCPATIEITVRQTRAGWTRLPLRLDGLVPTAAPRYEGPGRVVVDADPDGGYRGWFDAAQDAGDVRHTVVLEGTLPVERTESHETLPLRLPVATATTVELHTPRTAPAVAVLPPPPGRPAVTPAEDGTSTVTVVGLSGAVRIRLAAAGAADAGWESVPQSIVESVLRIDGRSAFTDAAIRLENLPPGSDSITVALPPRTVLRGVRPPATLVARGGTAEAPTATIAIERGRDGRAVVDLECERPVDPSGEEAFEAIGFAVAEVESWRQWGRVSLVVEGDWRAEWADRPGVRRVDPPPAARRPGFVAAFAYDALPAALPVRVRPRVSRMVVEPEYRFDVGATRVSLEARLRVVARGAPAAMLVLDIDPTFDVDEVGPAGVVDMTAVTSVEGRVTIPFLQPLSGDAVVEVRAIRRIERDDAALAWRIPAPQADVVAPANVIVAGDSNIEILPDATASAGLVRQTAGGQPRADAPTALLYRMDGIRGSFAGTRRFLERRVEAGIDVRIRLDESEIDVAETIRLDVAHVPLEFVEFTVPDEVAATQTLEVRQDGVALDPFVVEPPLEAADTDGEAEVAADVPPAPTLMRVALTEPLLGTGGITLTYRLPMPQVPPETTVATDLPLIVPAGARLERQLVAIESGDRATVDVRGDGWRAEVTPDESTRVWAAARPHTLVPLAIAARRRAAVEAVAEASWLRTHLLPDRREDVATYVLVGGGDALTLSIPGGSESVTCTVTLDGVVLPTMRDAMGRLVATLPRSNAGRRRVLEVRTLATQAAGWSAAAARLGLPTRLRLDPPEFGAGIVQRRFYWEVTTRPDELVLGAPDSWTAQQRWRLGRAGVEREPAVAASDLASWVAAAAGTTTAPAVVPAAVEGRALWSGIGPPGRATLWVVPTWFTVLVASGASLAVGLTFAYVAATRRPAVVVPLLAIVALAAAALPDLAPLAAQAALPGVALSLVAWGLRAVLDRRPAGAESVAPESTPAASVPTRAVSAPSLVVAGSSLESGGSVTGGGRSSP